MSFEIFNINLLDSGGTVADLHAAVDEAFEDIHDQNKSAVKPRRVELVIDFIPDEDRLKITTKAVVKKKFPSDSPRIDMIQIEPSSKTGYINVSEQLPLGYDPETGEVSALIRKDVSND